MIICNQCFYWTPTGEEDAEIPEHGLCTRAMFYGDNGDAMITRDGSMYHAALYTRNDHGCLEYVEAEC
jgi:hypothetical protein